MASSRTILPAFLVAAMLPLSALSAEPKHYGDSGIAYVAGGVGDLHQEVMQEIAPKYSLGLTFSTQDGAYLADVGVEIKNRAGEQVFSTVADGPMLLVDLPSGSYQVEATFDGKQQQRRVNVSEDGHRQLVMRW